MTRYAHCAEWNREELTEDVHRVVQLLCGDFLPALARYEHVDLLGDSPTSVQLLDRLRAFCTSENRRTDDYLVVYLTGHGEILEDGDYVLLASDTQPSDLQHRTVPASEIAKRALAGTAVRRLLLMLDTCYSGRGSERLGTRVLEDIGRLTDHGEEIGQIGGRGVAVVSSTCPYQDAQPGAFTQCLARAARGLAAAGNSPTLQVAALIGSINQDKRRPPWQSAVCHLLGLRDGEPEFLVNPRYDARLVDVDLLEQERVRHAEQQQNDLRERFETPWFTGRHRALTDLRDWLADSANACRTCVVTGDPGSGKTALLGLIAALSNPDHAIGVSQRGLPVGFGVPAGAIAEAIYAGTLTTAQVGNRIASAAELRVNSVQELIDGLSRPDTGPSIVVLVDALDESADPIDLITGLLAPLIQHCHRRVRLLLGTRRHSKKLLGWPDNDHYKLIDLDEEPYADPDSICAYAKQILLSEDSLDSTYRPSGIYRTASKAAVDGVVKAIGAAAEHSFLVARITATTEATAVALADFNDPAWQDSLPRRAGEAMRRDLQVRLGDQAAKAAHLLLPLAYAQGSGMPWEDMWPRLANALTPGHHYSSDDLVWLRTAAGSYVVEGLSERRSVYRLYHQALVEYLIEGRDRNADQRIITETLLAQVPMRADGQPDWTTVHPYTRTYLATHAARAERLNALLTDPGFLLAASRRQLLDSLDTVDSLPDRATADAYCRAARHLRSKPQREHASYLQLAARYSRASDLADALDAHIRGGTWTTRWASWRYQPPHQTLTGHTQPINAVAVSKLGKRPVVISGSDDGTVRVWDLTKGTPIHDRLTGHTWSVTALAVGELAGGPVVISTGLDRRVRVWDLTEGTPIGEPFIGHARPVTAVAVSELQRRPVVISGSDDRTVRVWDLAEGTQIGEPFICHTDHVTAVAVGELGGRPVVISGSDDRTVRVWDLAEGTQIGEPFICHTDHVTAVAVGELGGRPVVISGSDDHTVRMWDLATRTPISIPFTGHTQPVTAVAMGQLQGVPVVISGSTDATVRLWDLTTGTPIGQPFTGHTDHVTTVAIGELEGRPVVISGSNDRTVRVWEWKRATRSSIGNPSTGHTRPVTAVAVSELSDHRSVVISGSTDATMRLWDLTTGTPIGKPFTGHTDHVTAVAVGELGGRPVVISGSDDRTVRMWDITTGAPIGNPFTVHTQPITAVAMTELQGVPVMISGSVDRTVRLWDLTTGTPIGKPFTGHTDHVTAVAVGELGGRPVVISGSNDRTVRGWDLSDRQPLRSSFLRVMRLRHSAPVRTVVLHRHHNQLMVLAGCGDGTRWTWDLSTGTRLHPGGRTPSGPAVNAIAILNRDDVVYAAGNVITIGPAGQSPVDALTIDLESEVLAIATDSRSLVVVATTLGLVVLEVLRP